MSQITTVIFDMYETLVENNPGLCLGETQNGARSAHAVACFGGRLRRVLPRPARAPLSRLQQELEERMVGRRGAAQSIGVRAMRFASAKTSRDVV